MTPILQTRHGARGNCYAACIASITEAAIETVESLLAGATWPRDLRRWARAKGWRVGFPCAAPSGYAVASQRLLDGTTHAVVTLDGAILHDPSPRPFGHARWPVVLWTSFTRSS